ncbi:MAG: 4-hydroxybenzoate polyprenyltransferase [Verrucomicrobiales bacterium]|nr:4-hydroxybenzoate polyprenyltransferase [Verrucomicrobiales bacterium]
MFSTVRKWAEFVRLSHTIFALPFALAAMVVAARDKIPHGWPGQKTFWLILTAMVCARTCAMAFNRIADREFDKRNPRTANRHLPSGQISLASAWTLCILSGLGLIVASFFINRLCFYLSPVAIIVVCFYSLTKRFTDFSHVFLGIALALAPIGAWLAVKGEIVLWPWHDSFALPLLLASAVVFWLIGFDIIYAMQDYEFDRSHGLHSLVVRWGINNALTAAFLSHMVMVMILGVFGLLCGFKIAYLIGVAIIAFCLVIEHWLARRRSLNWVQNAFFRLNALISLVFLAVTATEVVFPFFRMTN